MSNSTLSGNFGNKIFQILIQKMIYHGSLELYSMYITRYLFSIQMRPYDTHLLHFLKSSAEQLLSVEHAVASGKQRYPCEHG